MPCGRAPATQLRMHDGDEVAVIKSQPRLQLGKERAVCHPDRARPVVGEQRLVARPLVDDPNPVVSQCAKLGDNALYLPVGLSKEQKKDVNAI